MTLRPESVTAASRVMLPTYPVLFAAIGIDYLTNTTRLQASPGLRYVDTLMPLPGWGLLFLAAAVLMVGALLLHTHIAYRYALWICLISSAIFAVALTGAVLHGETSFTAPLWPAFVARCCWASDRSLLTRET